MSKHEKHHKKKDETLDQQKIQDIIGRCLKYFNRIYEPPLKSALSEEYGDPDWKGIVEKAASSVDGGDYMSATTFGRGAPINSSTQRFAVKLSASSAWDTQNIIGVIQRHWSDLFAHGNRWLTSNDRNLLFDVRNCRNKWAHHNHFTLRDTYRYIDSIQRLLELISDKNHEWEEVNKMRNYVLLYLANEVKRESKKKKEEKHSKQSSSKQVTASSPEYYEEEDHEEEYNEEEYEEEYPNQAYHNNNSSVNFQSSRGADERHNRIYSQSNYVDNPQPQPIHHHHHQQTLQPQLSEELIQKFSTLSGLSREFTILCLSEANYNPEKAWELYVSAREAGNIPPNAWMNN